MTDKEEIYHLITLLDDEDPVVKDCVDKRFASLGSKGLKSLETALKKIDDDTLRPLILAKMEQINCDLQIDDFKKLAEDDKATFSLFDGGYIISALIDRKARRLEYESLLCSMAAQVLDELSSDKTAVENCRIFCHLFYNRFKFNTCDTLMTNEDNALILKVLKSRKGNPIAIALLFFILAQECNIPLLPVCFPGGFVPAYMEHGKKLFYINIFQSGELFSENKFKEYMSLQGISADDPKIEVRSLKTVMSAYLESLLYFYSGRNPRRYAAIEKALNLLGNERILSIDEEQGD